MAVERAGQISLMVEVEDVYVYVEGEVRRVPRDCHHALTPICASPWFVGSAREVEAQVIRQKSS